MLGSTEVLDQWQTLRTLTAHTYREDPDWASSEPPDHLLPIATDLEGNLKCLDYSTPGPDVVDWHRETCTFTTWHASVVQWFMTCLQTLAIRFDRRGRPRPIRAGEAETIRRREIEAHLAEDPQGTYPLLELAQWYVENRPPEEALFSRKVSAVVIAERWK